MAYFLCLLDCGKEPGFDTPWLDSTINWLRETTADQLRIENWLEGQIRPESVLLHVGVGNSGLALRFGSTHRVVVIDGVTLGAAELDYALSSGWYNSVRRANKYSRDFFEDFSDEYYDFIIDNNLSSYACCQKHFLQMMRAYTNALKPGGMILTDRVGLAHAPGDPNWNLTDDLAVLAKDFNLALITETETVLALRK